MLIREHLKKSTMSNMSKAATEDYVPSCSYSYNDFLK